MLKLKNVIDTDIVNYKKISMVLEFPYCTFKCDKEAGTQVCQNCVLAESPTLEINEIDLINNYLNNPITEAIVCMGLEPIDSFEELLNFIGKFREVSNDDIVIYTGYYSAEIESKIKKLKEYNNIIVKFGRFIPNRESKFDNILGVTLASNNQYSERIS